MASRVGQFIETPVPSEWGEILEEEKGATQDRSGYMHRVREAVGAMLCQIALLQLDPGSLREFVAQELCKFNSTAKKYSEAEQIYNEGKQRSFQLLDSLDMQLRIPSKKVGISLIGEGIKSTGRLPIFESSNGSSLAPSQFKNATSLTVCVEKGNSACHKVPLPQPFSNALLRTLKKPPPAGRCCFHFVNEIYHKNVHGSPCSLELEQWKFQQWKEDQPLAPGEPICLSKKGKPQHYAVHLSQGLYLSVYGNDNHIIASTLKELKEAYPSDAIYKMEPK